jgi:hypothetical protein
MFKHILSSADCSSVSKKAAKSGVALAEANCSTLKERPL